MKSLNHKFTYIWSICIGGIGGLLFLFFFLVMLGKPTFFSNPTFERLHTFIAFVSLPVFYLIGDKLSLISSTLGPPLFVLYWVILGMGISCGLVWLYFLISHKSRIIINSSGKAEPDYV